jgi:hypothetical protein
VNDDEYTVGEAVRNAASEHVPYAHAFGLWSRGMGQFLPALEAGWQPYLASEELGDETSRRAAYAQSCGPSGRKVLTGHLPQQSSFIDRADQVEGPSPLFSLSLGSWA